MDLEVLSLVTCSGKITYWFNDSLASCARSGYIKVLNLFWRDGKKVEGIAV